MNTRRFAAFSASLLLGLSVATVANANPWHKPHVPVSSDGHASAPSVPGTHSHGAPPGGGLWHAIPVAAPHAGQFASGNDHWHHDGDHDWDHHGGHHDWGHGDIHFFHHYDWYAWHNGYWHHGWYGPRFGWWWVVSGVWFFYPVPVYPYPDPYLPSDWAAPPPPAGEAMPAAGSYWYFCPASNGYYPYVPSCPTGWQQVPAQPADAQDAPSATTAAPPPPDGPPGG